MNTKIFGYTVVNSAGWNNAMETHTKLYDNQSDTLKDAYKKYKSLFEEYKDALEDASEKCLANKEFKKDLIDTGYVLIQLCDSHIQIEYGEFTLN